MNKADKLLYQENKAGSNLVVLFVLLNVAFTIYNLRVMPVDLDVGIFVMYNILVSLVAFLASTMMLRYNKRWGYAGLVIAVIQFLRIFNIPEGYETGFDLTLKAMVVLSAVCLLAGSIITIRRATIKSKYEAQLKAQ